MSSIKVHGSNTSTATLRVVAALHEKQLDFQFPFGQVPAFEDGDLQLFGNTTHTQRSEANSILGAWMEAEAHQFDIPGSALVWELMYKNKIYGQPPKPSIVEENEAKLASVLDVYEARLANSKRKTIDERPRVSAWAKDILARPSWEKTIAMWDK
ncbi:Glutathione S-transferase, partial [Bienertia sinuspersici]